MKKIRPPKPRKEKRPPCPVEHDEQVRFVNDFRWIFPDVLIYANPNGGFRSIRTAMALKEEGVVPGIPDLHVPAWNLWIEMKRQYGGTLSPSQKEVIEYLRGVGHTVIVGLGADDALAQVNHFVDSWPNVDD